MDISGNAILAQAIRTYGREPQILKAIEEMSELTKELCKKTDKHHIAEEVADVTIMLEQVMMMLDIKKAVADFIRSKLLRLQSRIENQEAK